MRAIFQIFRKDARRLALPILVLIALESALAWGDVQPVLSGENIFSTTFSLLRKLILPVVWIFLVTTVVLQERLPGSSQYWLTRPIGWPRLLAAKALFVAVFVCGGLFLIDCGTLAALHLPLHLWTLVGLQVRLSVMLLLPAFCVASLTKGLDQVVFSVVGAFLGIILALILQSRLLPSVGDVAAGTIFDNVADRWIWLGALAVNLVVILFQYVWRFAVAARFLFLLPLMLFPTGMRHDWLPSTFVENANSSEELPAMQIFFDLSSGRHPAKTTSDDFVGLQLPVRIEGLPSSAVFVEGWVRTNTHDYGPLDRCVLYKSAAGDWLRIDHDPNDMARLTRKPLDLNLHIQLALFEQRPIRTAVLSRSNVFSPAVDVNCRISAGKRSAYCWSGVEKTGVIKYLVSFPPNSHSIQVRLDTPGLYGFTALLHSPVRFWMLQDVLNDEPVLPSMMAARQAGFVERIQLGTVDRQLSAQNVDLTPYIVTP